MAVLNLAGFECGDTSECRSVTGTLSVQSAVKRTGGYALRVNPTGSNLGHARFSGVAAGGTITSDLNVATLYTRFYFRYATRPSSGEEQFLVVLDTGGADKAFCCLNSAGKIELFDNNGIRQATGTAVLAQDTWYRIEVKTSTGSGNQPCEVRVDGTADISASINQLTNNNGSVRLGKVSSRAGVNIDYYYDDLSLNDSAWPGEGAVEVMLPDSNGSTAQWTSGTNSSNYAEVDEIPTDSDTTYIKCGTGGNQVHLVGLESCASAGVSGTINAVKAWVRAREDTSVTSSLRVRVRSGGTNSDTSGSNLDTTYASRFRLLTADPATSAAWTTSGLDAVEVGVVEANAVAMRCTNIALMVDFTPDAAGPQTITATRLASSSALYTGATVTASATISPTRLASAATVRTGATVSATNGIAATRLASAAQVRGGATVSAAATISATRIASAAAVRAGATLASVATVAATRLESSAEVRSGATVSAVATITATRLASSAQVRSGGAVSATATITATRLASSGTVRTGATVSQDGASQTVAASRIASASAVRSGATVTPGAVTIAASRLGSAAQVRSGATVAASAQVTATRLGSAAQVRAGAILTPGAVTVTATRIEAASAIRTGAILTPGAVAIAAARLAATSSVRGGVVLSASTTIGATRISAASLVRSGHTLTPGEVAIQAARLAAASAVRSGARIGLVYQPVPSRAPLAAQGREEIAGNVRAGASGRSRMGELTPAKRNHFTGRDRP